MPKSDDLVNEIQSAEAKLKVVEAEHASIKSNITLGPMDVVTPWTATGTEMKMLRDKIKEKTFELGQTVLRERGS